MPDSVKSLSRRAPIRWSRVIAIFAGFALFLLVYFSPAWPDAVDPAGKHFILSREGKGALAIFLLAGAWWVFEVIPIGTTGLVVGLLQALFFIRPAARAFKDFMDPSIVFVFASITIGMALTKTGLTRRFAYKILVIMGERTSIILLGCLAMTAALTHVMAHTAVAAAIYPLLLAIYSLYGDQDKPTRFGRSLFIGMAYVAGAGSIITLLGSARAAVAIGFFKEITGREIGFFELSYYLFPLGWLMVFFIWGYLMLFSRPERSAIPGLGQKARQLEAELGPLTKNERLAGIIILSALLVLLLKCFIPALKPLDKTAILLFCPILFYLFRILNINDLEQIPWNIILLFGGAMSIGSCLWQTGAAQWLAVGALPICQKAGWFLFVVSTAFLVMVMTNFITNVVVIAICLPVALTVAPYLGLAYEAILFVSLVAAGMPLMLLIGAAPNAIAYDSRQFTSGQFFRYGVPASVFVLTVLGLAVSYLWPSMGMPVFIK